MPKFVASIEVYFDADSQSDAADVADAIGDSLGDWNFDPFRVHVTAITTGVAPEAKPFDASEHDSHRLSGFRGYMS